jgi:hypothetical protein
VDLSEDGQTMSGLGEMSEDGETWQEDIHITYRRA